MTSAAQAAVTEAVHAVPAPPLRGLIASYHGYRRKGCHPPGTAGCPRRT